MEISGCSPVVTFSGALVDATSVTCSVGPVPAVVDASPGAFVVTVVNAGMVTPSQS